MKNLYSFIALFLAVTLLFSCEKKVTLDESPNFMILPIYNGERLSSQLLTQSSLKYQHLNAVRTVKDFKRASGVYAQKGVLSSTDVITLSAVENIKYFELSIPGFETMEIMIDAQHLSEKEAKAEACYCDKPVRKVIYDGAELDIEQTSTKGAHVYKIYLTKS